MTETSEATSAKPVEIRAPEGALLLEIVWDNGTTSLYSHRVLRGFCPCAHCQGHQGPIQWVATVESLGPKELELSDVREVGAYALGLTFGDGHGSGIYTFRYLEQLGALYGESVESMRGRSFER
ncbi:MAG: DUF971 domain-containing protein [Polyangiaceae bacterium]|nr:DUF971 domain-containing protein [Polyangiaceae bacterium]